MSSHLEAAAFQIGNFDGCINFLMEVGPMLKQLVMGHKWGIVRVLLGTAIKVPTHALQVKGILKFAHNQRYTQLEALDVGTDKWGDMVPV
jgi:hypothetical protein